MSAGAVKAKGQQALPAVPASLRRAEATAAGSAAIGPRPAVPRKTDCKPFQCRLFFQQKVTICLYVHRYRGRRRTLKRSFGD
jgi:hypothetical protein